MDWIGLEVNNEGIEGYRMKPRLLISFKDSLHYDFHVRH